ncbi:hypothetical protein, partial [Bifidobacterium myosotis]
SPTGTTFRMKDFLVYFPVGADVQSVEPQNQTAAASNHPDWLFSSLRQFVWWGVGPRRLRRGFFVCGCERGVLLYGLFPPRK